MSPEAETFGVLLLVGFLFPAAAFLLVWLMGRGPK